MRQLRCGGEARPSSSSSSSGTEVGKETRRGAIRILLGWRRIRDLSTLDTEGAGGEGGLCRAGIRAARYFNPKRGGAQFITSVRHTPPPRYDRGLPGAPTFENANESFFHWQTNLYVLPCPCFPCK